MRYAYAGDRQISVNILRFLIERGHKPLALFVVEGDSNSHSENLIDISGLDDASVFTGQKFKEQQNIEKLKRLELDYIFGIHFPYIIPEQVLELPKIGFLNLHPAFLPFNKGWNTPSWAILEKTPYGATLHFMAKELDAGAIIHQKEIEILPNETAHTLYERTLKLEEEIFIEAFPKLEKLNPDRKAQTEKGTSHSKKDLQKVQKINLDETVSFQEAIDKIRALTTNSIEEAAYFEVGKDKYAVQLVIKKIASET